MALYHKSSRGYCGWYHDHYYVHKNLITKLNKKFLDIIYLNLNNLNNNKNYYIASSIGLKKEFRKDLNINKDNRFLKKLFKVNTMIEVLDEIYKLKEL